ncbi:MAG: C40 family peptidase, partial [Lachnospiraceae bacterium]|nr:C40 family peptidase [Lachnospiraceae bacterium]
CSGFTQSVYKAFGISIPRTSWSQQRVGSEVSLENARAGDIVCYAGHVAIYLGNGQIVHASTERTGIKYGNVNYKPIMTIRRVV